MERLVDAICATCTLCEFMPEQVRDRLLVLEPIGSVPAVLVVDDTFSQRAYDKAIAVAQDLLGLLDFSYTTSIRCSYTPPMPEEHLAIATSRCAVWTNQLLEGRKLVLTTRRGLAQMKVGQEQREGDAFRTPRFGVVLCIPPLLKLDAKVYLPKVERALREAGLA